MIGALLSLALVWAGFSAVLWTLQSDAKGGLIDISWRDRAVALLWLPLLIGLGLWSLACWIHDSFRCFGGRCA